MPAKCIFTLGTLDCPLPLLFFCFFMNASLLWLSTLGYVNKPMVGRGMHIVGLHSAEKMGDKDNHLHLLSIFLSFWYNQPSHLLSNFNYQLCIALIALQCTYTKVSEEKGYIEACFWPTQTLNLQLSFMFEHEHSHLLNNCTEVQVNCAWDLSSVHND